MKQFILKILKITLFYLLILLAISYVLELVIYKNTQQKQYLLQADWEIHKNKNYNILIIGNSRVYCQINSEQISKNLNLMAFDLAQDGRGLKVIWAKFKLYSKTNRNPSDIFLLYDPYFIDGRTDNTFYGKENYLSYIFLNRVGINYLFNNEKGFNKYEVYMPLVRYRGYQNILMEHLFGKHTNSSKQDSSFKYGSVQNDWIWNRYNDTSKINAKNWNNPLVTNVKLNEISYIDSFRLYCNQNNIKLHLFYPPQSWPSYNKVSKKNKDELAIYAKKNDLEFFDFNSPIYIDSSMFYNHMHLNKKGNDFFTKKFLNHYFNK